MSYPKTGEEVYVSLNLSNTMLTGLGKGTITREDVSVDYLKKLFMQHGVIVSAKPEYRNIMERVNSTYDLGLEIPAKLQLFQLSEQHRRLVVVNISGLQRKNGSPLPPHPPPVAPPAASILSCNGNDYIIHFDHHTFLSLLLPPAAT